MKMLLISCVAGVLSSSGLAQAPDLSGKGAFVVNPHDLACMTGEGVIVQCPSGVAGAVPFLLYGPGAGPDVVDHLGHADEPTSADRTRFPGQGTESEQRSQLACGDRGTEGHAPGSVTILRGSR